MRKGLDERMQMLSVLPKLGENQSQDKKVRFLLYSHDTFGLGHLRRALALATHFTATLPNAEVLIVTGSPLAHSFALPPRTDYVKLPAVTKLSSGTYRARNLDLEFAAIRDLRATLLRETARAYRPNVFLVDHAPQGLKGEVLPTLALLRDTQPQCLRVLGLRDIMDASYVVRQAWREEGIYQTLEHDYDLVLVYGSQKLYDIGAEYALPASVDRRVRYCGYLDRVADEDTLDAPTRLDPRAFALRYELFSSADRLVALTAGGGGDAFPLMHAYLLGLQRLPALPFASVLLTGPLMAEAEQRELRDLAATLPAGTVRIESFLSDPLPLLRAADLVVAMAGYNTTCELLALRQRALLVPRATPRQEQLIRASLLARHGLVQMLHPDMLTPETLIERVQQSLLQPRPQERQLEAAGISFDAQALASQAIMEELDRLDDRRWMVDPLMARAA
jgi:predicted glycosyltransferase